MEDQAYRFRAENQMTAQRTNEFNAGYQETLRLYHILRLFEIYMLSNFAILMLLLPRSMGALAPKMLGLGAFLLFLELVPRLAARKGNLTYRRSLVTNGGREVRNELLFFENRFLDRNLYTGNAITYTYDDIRRVFQTRNLLVIMLDARLGLMVEKAGLSGGTQEEFSNFLLEKSVKIKKKKIRSVKFGQVLRYIMLAAVVVMMLAALLELPSVQYRRNLRKDPTAAMSFQQVADSLENLGITGSDEWLVDSLDQWYASLSTLDKAYTNKAYWLMAYTGDQAWDPGDHGVCWLYLMPENPNMMYRDLLENLSILAPELELGYLSEDQNESPDGARSGTLNFSCRGEIYHAFYYGDWIDMYVLQQLQTILASDDDPRYLYCTSDVDDSILIFYRDTQWAEKFTAATGIELHSGI